MFRVKLSGVLHDLNYIPTNSNPYVWIRAVTKKDVKQYYEMALCYVYDLLVISKRLVLTIEGLKPTFKLKGDKAESPKMYLGSALNCVTNDVDTKCWTMSSEY